MDVKKIGQGCRITGIKMKLLKWKKYRAAKWKFPTRCDMKGCPSGSTTARAYLEQTFKVDLRESKKRHTKGEWVFLVPLNSEKPQYAGK